MAIQILPESGLGERLGSALGTGLSAGLQSLAQQKLGELQQQKAATQTATGLQSLLGLSPEESKQWSMLPPELLQLATKQRLQAPQQQAYAKALAALGMGGEMPTEIPEGLTERQTGELAKLKLQQQKAAQQQKQFETKEERIKEHRIAAETLPYYNEVKGRYASAVESDRNIAKWRNLIQSGEMTHPLKAALLKSISKGVFGVGIDLSSLLSPSSSKFEKITNAGIKTIAKMAKGKLTNYEVETWLKTLPSILNSPEGNLLLLEDLEQMNKYDEMENDLMEQIIEANNGLRPANLRSQVEKALKSQSDLIVNRIKEQIKQYKEPVRIKDAKFEKMYPASQYKDERIVDEDTGEIRISNGKKWFSIKG